MDSSSQRDGATDTTVVPRDASQADSATDAPAPVDVTARSSITIVGTTDNAGYSTARFRALLARRGAFTHWPSATIDDALLSDARLLVVAHLTRAIDSGERDALRRFVHGPARGRVLVLAGYRVEQTSETNSVLQALSMRVEPSTLLFTPPTQFAEAAVSAAGLTEPPLINGAFVFEALPANAAPEIYAAQSGRPILAARYENGGRAFVYLDEWATFDVQLVNDNVVRFWNNVLDDLLR